MEEKLSFTQQIKEELTTLDLEESVSKSLLSGFIRINGSLLLSSDGEKLVLKTENSKIAKFIYSELKKYFHDLNISFSYRRLINLNKNTQYIINIANKLDDIFNILNLNFLDSKIPFSMTDKDEKVKGYLAGLFLASGSCNDPHSSNYHLEISCHDEDFAYSILKLIKKVKEVELPFKVSQRRNQFIVYLKRSESISEFLAIIDAQNSCLDFENIRVDRDFANVSNRLTNMDVYNYEKTLQKGEEQCKQINEIEKYLGLKNIVNDKLRELCYLRLENKESSYSDLAEMLSEKIGSPVSKSNINHLFIKIKKMSEEHIYGV